ARRRTVSVETLQSGTGDGRAARIDRRQLNLRNDIRRNLGFDKGDAVAQLRLALLQPLQPQQIRRGGLVQGIDRRIEIAVFLLQPCKLGFEFALILVGHDAFYPKNAKKIRWVAESREEYPPARPGPQAGAGGGWCGFSGSIP